MYHLLDLPESTEQGVGKGSAGQEQGNEDYRQFESSIFNVKTAFVANVMLIVTIQLSTSAT